MRIISRNAFVFMTGAIAVTAGLLFPLSARVLDVLLVFSISLTAAILVITVSARAALQVQGFPLMVVLAAALRIALGVACNRLIFSQGDAGAIVNIFSSAFAGSNCVVSVLVFGVLAAVSFGIIYKAVKGIGRVASEFTVDTIPVRQGSIESKLSAGVINESQALEMRKKAAREAGFFITMAGAARFTLCGAIIEFLVVIISIISGLAAGVMMSTDAGLAVKVYVVLAVGTGVLGQGSALVVAVVCGYLVRKSVAAFVAEGEFKESDVGRIKVVAEEVTSAGVTEMWRDNATSYTEKDAVAEDVEWADESVVVEDRGENLDLWDWEEVKSSNCYEVIAETIEGKSDAQAKTILMAAEGVEELGVTVPVNVAMHLVRKGRKCLLIDLDMERGAVSKVFDIGKISGSGEQAGPLASCVSNLWIWPVNNFGESSSATFQEAIDCFEGRYDHLIIYAPNVKRLGDCAGIAGCVQTAMLFGGTGESKEGGSAVSELRRLLVGRGCRVLGPMEVFAEAL